MCSNIFECVFTAKAMVHVLSTLRHRRRNVCELPSHDGDRAHWLAHRGAMTASWHHCKCSRCNFAEVKFALQQSEEFLLLPGHPQVGTWLESKEDKSGSWHVRCLLCNVELSGKRYRQFSRHASSHRHRNAIQDLNFPATADHACTVPKADQFQQVLDHVRNSPLGQNVELMKHVGGRHKQRRMLWCLAEAARIEQRAFLKKCKSMSIYQDARKSWLLDRWSAADSSLICRF